jgi:hypothetical protein
MTGGVTGLALLATARWLSRPLPPSATPREQPRHGDSGTPSTDSGEINVP